MRLPTPPSSGTQTPTGVTEIRSPSPQKHNTLGLLSASSTSAPSLPAASSSMIETYPHLGHYIYGLLHSISQSPPRANGAAHPLSVSSSGESDDSDEDAPGGGGVQETPKKNGHASHGYGAVDKEALVRKIVKLIDNEEEEQVKDVLRPHLGEHAKDDILMDQVCLDCMHKRRDDAENVPFQTHFTPARPAARSSPSLNSIPRPYTPTRLPSFRARTPVPSSRPHSPLPPGAHTPTMSHPSSALARSESGISPTIPTTGLPSSSSGYSSSGSPATSPKVLNAKAATFNPVPRSVSGSHASTPFSPSDPWKDVPAEAPRSASPFGAVGPISMARTSSNLAIASPLFNDQTSPFHSPIGTPSRGTVNMPDVFSSPKPFPRTTSRSLVPDDDDDDEFSPFGSGLPKLHHHGTPALNTSARAFTPGTAGESSWNYTPGMPQSESGQSCDSYGSGSNTEFHTPDDEAVMTPLDVLAKVFASISKAELEDALHRANYDFEGAMSIVVAAHTVPRSGSGASTPQRVASPRPLLGIGGRGTMPLAHSGPRDGYFQQGGRSYAGHISPGLGGRSPGGIGARMCRYFLNGECRRSDCRFSHDLDRALCRFWMKGHCAKGPNCEFMHHLPANLDPSALHNAMSRVELSRDGSASYMSSGPPTPQPHDDFPDLLSVRFGQRPAGRFDPSRNRFANALKRSAPAAPLPSVQITGARQMAIPTLSQAQSGTQLPVERTPMPKPSHRIKLRPPTLLPTVKTGVDTNQQYMDARATSIRLGAARNACLARAGDAFRRGDGAAAKRFSREGRNLNEKMLLESAEAGQILAKDRQREVMIAVRERDPNWSDDPSDRAERGKSCGGDFGVILGVASRRKLPGGEHLSMEERRECLLDLHTLHGNECPDVLGVFFSELERENFRGLAYLLVGEEKHVGQQDPSRGVSKVRLGAAVKQFLADYGYPWNESAGVLCVDPCRV